ncbi:MAG: S-layer homology domain-containing protein [Oscillospiraceae bacterium]|nr:S-layer homology domain-containing protein [Oscillospiraceae bacterium]
MLNKTARRILPLLLCVLLLVTPALPLAIANDNLASFVIYNLGTQEIVVGTTGEETATQKLFDADGNYNIRLENNAFFPYEAQFQVDGVTTVERFETPDSAVTVGGHTFTVSSMAGDKPSLSQIGVTIGDEYVAAKQEPKVFLPTPGIRPQSLLPLQETYVTLDLKSYPPASLREVKFYTVLSELSQDQIAEDEAAVVWIKRSSGSDDDRFEIAKQTDTIDLSPEGNNRKTSFELELIVGTANQLDPNNKRYIVSVETSSRADFYNFSVYTESDRERVNAQVEYNFDKDNNNLVYNLHIPSTYTPESEFILYLSLNEAFSATYDLLVYSGQWSESGLETAAAAGKEISDDILNESGRGWKADFSDWGEPQKFTIVFKKDAAIICLDQFEVHFSSSNNGIYYDYGLYDQSSQRQVVYSNHSPSEPEQRDSVIYTTVSYTLYREYPASGEYYFALEYLHEGLTDHSRILKAVVGLYDSLESAENTRDIKDDLFPDNAKDYNAGYLGNYSGNGVDFTIFLVDGRIYQVNVKAIDGIYRSVNPDRPDIRSDDTYFRMTGAVGLDTYTVPFLHDSLYSMGYQTLLILDELDEEDSLTSLAPTFWNDPRVKIFAGSNEEAAEEQRNGSSPQNFSGGSVLYTAIASNEEIVRNYSVSFVKKHFGGSKLFVNGPVYSFSEENDQEDFNPEKREVFLDALYENMHDIFIANIGDEPLNGICVKLDATNVKLDDYWTVGGAGNNTLAPFTETSHEGTPNGELANVAKIRLLPDGTGDITGTLTITAEGQEPLVIYLSGLSGNPGLITETVPEAVKFVPYSALLRTSNKYTWNKVTFELVEKESERLPDGVNLLPTGEIYGVPTECGKFTFSVRVDYGDSIFSPSEGTFTLKVLKNTDTNVLNNNDYSIIPITPIPSIITFPSNQIFTIIGEETYNEFMKFFIDGMEMLIDQDYDAKEGSTVITIRAKTFINFGTGIHTIAAEFRSNRDPSSTNMTKAAQNYTLLSTVIPPPKDTPPRDPPDPTPPAAKTIPDNPTKADGWENPYIDVNDNDWFYDTVRFISTRNLMKGTAANIFSPNTAMTRAMMVTILYRLENQPLVSSSVRFPDIQSGQWYTEAVIWAAENGIVYGYANGSFGWNDNVTREEFVTILYRYAALKEFDISASSELLNFTDIDDIGEWALEAMKWAVAFGIIQGRTPTALVPRDSATRAEVAMIIRRYLEALDKGANLLDEFELGI